MSVDYGELIRQQYFKRKAKTDSLEEQLQQVQDIAPVQGASVQAGNDGYQVGANSFEGLFSEGLYNLRHALTGGDRRYQASVDAAQVANQEAYDRERQGISDNIQFMDRQAKTEEQNRQSLLEASAYNTKRFTGDLRNQLDSLNQQAKSSSGQLLEWANQGLLESENGTLRASPKGLKNAEFLAAFRDRPDYNETARQAILGAQQTYIDRNADEDPFNDLSDTPDMSDYWQKITKAPSDMLSGIEAENATLQDEYDKLERAYTAKGAEGGNPFYSYLDSMNREGNFTEDAVGQYINKMGFGHEDRSEANDVVHKYIMPYLAESNLTEPQKRMVAAQMLEQLYDVESHVLDFHRGQWSDTTIENNVPHYLRQFEIANQQLEELNAAKNKLTADQGKNNLKALIMNGLVPINKNTRIDE